MNKSHKLKPTPDPEYINVALEMKAVGDASHGIIEGYASIFGVRDLGGDIVEPGAFTKTIAERVPAGKVKMFDTHQWDLAHLLGTVTDAREDSKGLWFKGELSKVGSVQEVREKALEGHITEASIGFDTVRETWTQEDETFTRHLDEVKLYEISPVPFGMNEFTEIGAKCVSFKDLPLAPDDYEPDQGQINRLRSWAMGNDDEINFARYRKAFLLWNRDKPTDLQNYEYPIADIIGGELKAIPMDINYWLAKARELADKDSPELVHMNDTLARYKAKMEGAIVLPNYSSQFAEIEHRKFVEGGPSIIRDEAAQEAELKNYYSTLTPFQKELLIKICNDDKAEPPSALTLSQTDLELRSRSVEAELNLSKGE